MAVAGPPPLRLDCLGPARKHQIDNGGRECFQRGSHRLVGSRNPWSLNTAKAKERVQRCPTRPRPEGSSPDQWVHETGRTSRASSLRLPPFPTHTKPPSMPKLKPLAAGLFSFPFSLAISLGTKASVSVAEYAAASYHLNFRLRQPVAEDERGVSLS
ncbi:hypothetical protein BHM03_00033423 [Ensete ventricosum]|nr:hypothetical protein BHM03_00033423 [Ensete ventricosum]